MNKLDKQYTDLLQTILEHGVDKKDRTGTGTKSIFGYTIRHNMKDGFPLLTTKKMPFKTIVTELLWFLQGNTNIKYLVDNNCHIWDGDAFKNYVNTYKGNFPMGIEEFIETIKTNDKFAERWGELGPIYGKQWRDWKGRKTDGFVEFESNGYSEHIKGLDQIQNLINDLKTNPDSRRMMVNAWNVGELDQMVLPPCHYGFQVYTRELSEYEKQELYFTKHSEKESDTKLINDEDFKEILKGPQRAISLMWNQRSVDTFLGLPFNIASYGLLLMMLADEVNMVPDQLIGNLGDVHLYSNHIEQAKEQIQREGFDLPTVHVRDGIHCSSIEDVLLFDYESHPAIKAPLSN
jgi:thymidylate synthase